MHNEHHAPHDQGNQGYEVSDLQLRVLLWAGIALVVMTFAAYIVSTFVVRYVNAQPPISEYDAPPIAAEARSKPFAAGVRLQVDVPVALEQHRKQQLEHATTYGVVSDQPEIYRIPVETAVDIVAERGLPVFPVLAPAEGETTEQQ